MLRYIVRRLLAAVPLLLLITFLNFALVRLAPGDPMLFMTIAGMTEGMNAPEAKTLLSSMKEEPPQGQKVATSPGSVNEFKRRQLGLDKPIPVQYVQWLGKLVRGDFGLSMVSYIPINHQLQVRIGVTLRLTLLSALISILIGIVIGTLCAIRQYSLFDNAVSLFTYVVVAIPGYLYATLFVLLFAMTLRWFPTAGMYDPRTGGGLGDRLYHLVLPLVAMGTYGSAGLIRYTRTSVLNVMRSDFVMVARAKGLPEALIQRRHILRNALLPVVTIIGHMIPGIIGGSALFETVFVFPGLGLWAAESAAAKDFSVMIAVTTVTATIMVLTNLLVDISYAVIDPRVRYT